MNDEEMQKSEYIDKKTQQMLNKPPIDPEGVDNEKATFMETVVRMIKDESIDLYKPETLVNKEVYDRLSLDFQAQVELEAMNLLAAIREIKELYDSGNKDSFQIKNLVERLKNSKERVETDKGDVFII